MTGVIDERLRDKDQEIHTLKTQMTETQTQLTKITNLMESYLAERKEEEDFRERERENLTNILNRLTPTWKREIKPEFTPETLQRIEQLNKELVSMKYDPELDAELEERERELKYVIDLLDHRVPNWKQELRAYLKRSTATG